MSKPSNRIMARRRPGPANERKPAASPGNSEIGRLAKRLSEWRKADDALDAAETHAERADENGMFHLPDGQSRTALIRSVHDELFHRSEALREYMSWVEPETVEDAQALAALLYEAFDLFDNDYVDDAFGCEESQSTSTRRPITEQDRARYRRDKLMINAMLRNIVGCLSRHTGRATGWETGLERSFSHELSVALAEAERLKTLEAKRTTKSAANDVAA